MIFIDLLKFNNCCLFCDQEFNQVDSNNSIDKNDWYKIQRLFIASTFTKYNCNLCNEFFIDADIYKSRTGIIGNFFIFSCNNLLVQVQLENDRIFISHLPKNYDSLTLLLIQSDNLNIPYFPLNFKKKNELHVKLKTYMLFS